jgi:alpha-methylacyl-CoA racemase
VPGPLAGVKVIELTGIGPGPFAAMLLSDMGAEVVKVDRAQWVGLPHSPGGVEVLDRGRRSIAVDLKQPDGVEAVLRLVESADALIEGYRPGVAERLGVGPDVCLARNPRLVYGRMTGWGQDGPLANAAGHDINYIALAGALAHFGRAGEKPTPPINVVGDFGGGGMFLAFGVVCAVLEARTSGQGQVVDAAMVDGTAVLMSMFWGVRAIGAWDERAGHNALDTGAPNYDVYETKDGNFVSLGSIEPQFYAEFLARTGLDQEDLPPPSHREQPEVLRARLTELFLSKTRDEWCELLEGTDVCFARDDHRLRGRPPARAGAAVLADARRDHARKGQGRRAHRRSAQGVGLHHRRGRRAPRGRRSPLIGFSRGCPARSGATCRGASRAPRRCRRRR